MPLWDGIFQKIDHFFALFRGIGFKNKPKILLIQCSIALLAIGIEPGLSGEWVKYGDHYSLDKNGAENAAVVVQVARRYTIGLRAVRYRFGNDVVQFGLKQQLAPFCIPIELLQVCFQQLKIMRLVPTVFTAGLKKERALFPGIDTLCGIRAHAPIVHPAILPG